MANFKEKFSNYPGELNWDITDEPNIFALSDNAKIRLQSMNYLLVPSKPVADANIVADAYYVQTSDETHRNLTKKELQNILNCPPFSEE